MSGGADGSLDPQGPVAEAMAGLWWLMLGLGTAVFVLFAVLLVRGLLRRPERDAAATSNRQLVRRWIVPGGVVMPLAVLVVVAGATISALRVVATDAPPDALTVEIVGHQWWWEVHYPDAGVTTANEVHIPVGRRVAFELTSADVIHSFWVPPLGGKLDALPDGINTLVLQADRPGRHFSQCAEFCGLQHANMHLLVTAEPEDDFAAWIQARREPPGEPAGATAQRGQEIFLSSRCVECHAVQGIAAAGRGGPDLTHFASRESIAGAVLPNTDENVATFVRDPHRLKQGARMPAADLADDDVAALVAYLRSLE